MAARIEDRLRQQAAADFVGRDEELDTLSACLADEGPLVVHVHGIAGVGKSALLAAFAARARARGATTITLDCSAIEPTAKGFLQALGDAVGASRHSLPQVVSRLQGLGQRVVLALDTYEVFRLMDTWLRRSFVPQLSDNVRLVLAGRQAPTPAWVTNPGWHGLFRGLTLESLDEQQAALLLAKARVNEDQARRINRFARGHPLSLKLSVSAVLAHPDLQLEEMAVQGVVHELTRLYLFEVEDPVTRAALECLSVVRRINMPLVAALCPEGAPQDVYERLAGVPVMETRADGLRMHDAVREAMASSFKASKPDRYRECRRKAWRHLRASVGDAGQSDLWRYTADMLYLIENPVVREAFFPSGAQNLVVEPAQQSDGEAILSISGSHDTAEAARRIDAWWRHLPDSFHVVRDATGDVVGFYCMFDPAVMGAANPGADRVVDAWLEHLRHDPVGCNESVLFLRRWLGREQGEAPSPVQAACWLDVKRAYMEMRPRLRRVYLPVVDLETYAPVATTLGFRPIDSAHVDLGGAVHHTAMLDFGPSSVDGWIAALVAAELEIEQGGMLDLQARELVLDDGRVALTPLEFGVMSYLTQHAGTAVSRDELLEKVWGREYLGGSNVVDAVLRTLRKKLGPRASAVKTVRGVGYRFQP